MSVQTLYVVANAVRCDQPGCDAWYAGRGDCGDGLFRRTTDLLDRARKTLWQVSADGTAWCPAHWHVECRECARTTVGRYARLCDDGWRWDLGLGFAPLCPDCSGARLRR